MVKFYVVDVHMTPLRESQHTYYQNIEHTLVHVGPKQMVLTPFRDNIWNRRQVSVGDKGVLPTQPRNRRGYALLAHTFGKMRSCATGEHPNT